MERQTMVDFPLFFRYNACIISHNTDNGNYFMKSEISLVLAIGLMLSLLAGCTSNTEAQKQKSTQEMIQSAQKDGNIQPGATITTGFGKDGNATFHYTNPDGTSGGASLSTKVSSPYYCEHKQKPTVSSGRLLCCPLFPHAIIYDYLFHRLLIRTLPRKSRIPNWHHGYHHKF